MNQEKGLETENILMRLKRETEKAHRETENQISFGKPEFSVDDYRRVLIKFYAFYLDFEPHIKKAIARQKVDFNYDERLKTRKLLADLRNLETEESQISAIPKNIDLPALDSAEKIYGALYVIEGSTLGGQIISRRLKERFGFDESNGAEFFSGYGAQTGKMWNDFRSAILKYAEISSKHDEIINSATETFEKFGKALREE